MVDELERCVEKYLEESQGICDQLCRKVDLWYERAINTIPKDLLNKPYREVYDIVSSIPEGSLPTTSLTSGATTSGASETRKEKKKLTATRMREKRAATIEKKETEASVALPDPPLPKGVFPTGPTGLVIRPKFDIRKPPTTARGARQGETLVSLKGSPVQVKTAEPIHVHVKKGKVVEVKTSNEDPSVKELCKAIENMYKKMG